MFILIFLSMFLFPSCEKARNIISKYNANGNWNPFVFLSKDTDESRNYDITHWVQQLHLQRCTFVEIGEGFCALFVEVRAVPFDSRNFDNFGVYELFLGICPCLTLHSWHLCSPMLTKQREADCSFNEATPYANTSARVHRRLCDIFLLSENAPTCNCSIPIAGQRLYRTEGFPTCFLNPLPQSLCSPRGVCGIARCSTTTIKGVHVPRCASNCHHKQPFCEEVGPWTSRAPTINSVWSRWSSSACSNTCGRGLMVATSSCHDQVTQKPALDCIGPGSFCCPDDFDECYCKVNIADGIMRVSRFTEPCVSIEECTPGSSRTFTFEGEPDPVSSLDFDDVYEDDDRERFEDARQWPKLIPPRQRRLLQSYHRDDDYVLRENRQPNKNFRSMRVHRSIPRSRSDDVADYEEALQEESDDEDKSDIVYEGSADEDEEEEDERNYEDEEETIDLRGSAKGRRSPRKRSRVARSDYVSVGFEGKPGVDEPMKKRAMKIRSVTEECEDDSTEAVQYYDYDASENTTSSRGHGNRQDTFDVKFVAFGALLVSLG